MKSTNSYRQILKATSIFGGVQIFNIIISIIRSKAIAILLGPAGMGIAGLLTSSTGLISVLTNFGLGRSAVKNIAEANESNDIARISKVVHVLRKLVWASGLLGAILCFSFASYLSEFSFDNDSYTAAFKWLSITLLLNQLTSGQFVLLQGMRKLKLLAKSNLLGSVLGLIVSLPLYYFYNIKGIVPALILTAIFSLGSAWFFSRKIHIEKYRIGLEETKSISKDMLTMGFMLSLSGLMAVGASYIVRIFISNRGGIEDVGLYTAGFAIVNTYVGLVFSAMASDYYPRLSGIAHNNKKSIQLINQQAEIGVLILAPILAVFFIFINWIVVLLYSEKFIDVNEMIHWAALGIYFKVTSWSIGMIFMAKGAANIYFWNQVIANIYMLILNILGYYFFGLTGLGISFFVSYAFHLIQVFTISHYKYNFSFNPIFFKIFGFQFSIGLSCFLIIKFVPVQWAYSIGILLILVSCWYSYMELDKRIDIKNIIKNNELFRKKR
jgi:O-antigen/teichoic acid export membrane protein